MARYLLWMMLCCLPLRALAAEDLISQFPDPAEVVRGIDRADPVETALWQQQVLDTLSALAAEVAPRTASGQPTAAANPVLDAYWRERSAVVERGMAALRGNATGAAAEAAAKAEYERRLAEFVPGPEFVNLVFGRLPTQLRERVRNREREMRTTLRMYRLAGSMNGLEAKLATTPAQQWSGPEHLAAARIMLIQASMKLPPAVQSIVQELLLLPGVVWLALLAAWLAWGIWRATRRFGFDPEDPARFWNGPRRYHFSAGVGQVVDLQQSTTVRETTTYTTETDSFGNRRTTPYTTSTTHEKQTIFLRDADGRERSIRTININLPVRPGHHLLDVAAYKGRAKSGPWVLYHNYDMDQTTFCTTLRDVVKVRPRAFIPFVLLATVVAVLALGYIGWFAFFVAPIVYGVALKFINKGRMRRFREQLLPPFINERRPEMRGDFIPVPGGGGFSRAAPSS